MSLCRLGNAVYPMGIRTLPGNRKRREKGWGKEEKEVKEGEHGKGITRGKDGKDGWMRELFTTSA